jgi:uncharacterized protein YjiS (DUF1127 family)
MTTIARTDAGLLVAGAERNLGTWATRVRQSWELYTAYRTTVAHLKDLTDRQLADLGTSRGEIARFARKAVYGN